MADFPPSGPQPGTPHAGAAGPAPDPGSSPPWAVGPGTAAADPGVESPGVAAAAPAGADPTAGGPAPGAAAEPRPGAAGPDPGGAGAQAVGPVDGSVTSATGQPVGPVDGSGTTAAGQPLGSVDGHLAPGPGQPGGPPGGDGAGALAQPAFPEAVKRRRQVGWRRGLTLAAVISFIAACAVGILAYLGYNIGLQALLIGLVAALVPVPVLVACFLWLDRYEPEPIRYLVFCFSWGAFVSTAAALGVNTGMSVLFERWGLPDTMVAVLVAPFIEELTKALGPILLLWRRRREWSGITDGLVYCGLSAVGFAMVENILYLGGHGYAAGAEEYGPATGAQMVFLIFIARILFTGFAHPLFTAMTGVGLGIAARAADRRVVWLAPMAGLLLAMILHGTWNLMPSLVQATGQTLILLYGYIAVMVPIFFGMVGLAVWLRGWEGRLTERTLPVYVRAGWLSPPEVAALSSLGRRHSARRWARRVSGDPGLKAMRGFQFAATQLALLRDGIQRGLHTHPRDVHHAAGEERRLLELMSGYRATFVGRDPQMPPAIWDGSRYHITFPDGVRRTLDEPGQPVVPVPILLPPPPPVPYGLPAGAGYPAQPGYAAQPGYPAPPGYPAQPGYAPQPGYPAQPGYGTQPGYGGQGGYAGPGGPAGHGGPGGNGAPGGYPVPAGGAGQLGAPQPGGSQPGYGDRTGPGEMSGSGHPTSRADGEDDHSGWRPPPGPR